MGRGRSFRSGSRTVARLSFVRYEPHEPHEPYETPRTPRTHEPLEPLEHDMFGSSEPARGNWLPRVAIVATLVGAGAAGVWLWPSLRGGASGGVTQASAPQETAPVEGNAPPAAVPTPVLDTQATAPAATQPTTDKPGALPADAAAAVAGFVAVFAPFDISISNASQPLTVDDRGRAMLPSGKYRLRFQNRQVGYDETRAVEVRPTETTTIQPRSANLAQRHGERGRGSARRWRTHRRNTL